MNHIYGSPFPTINPKVRYRTALERAGFDVNFGSGIPSNDNGVGWDARDQRGVMGTRSASAEPWTSDGPYSHAAAMGTQVKTMEQKEVVSGFHHPGFRQDPSDQSSGQFKTVTPAFETQVPSKSFAKQLHSSSAPSLRSGAPPDPQLRAGGELNEAERELNPIEKSFMMLTQNDVSSSTGTIDRPESSSRETSRESLSYSVKRESGNQDEQFKPGRDTVHSTVESLDFEPSSELHAGLKSPEQDENTGKFNRGTLPALTITTHPSEVGRVWSKKSSDSFDEGTVPPQYDHRPLGGDNENSYRSSAGRPASEFLEDVETPQTATNLQVKELLAQLDDVSYTKNAQLSTSILAATAANSLEGSLLDVHSLSVDRSRSCSNTSSRFKKSSAYLSQLPDCEYNISAQSVTCPDDNSNNSRAEDSPAIYKMKTSLIDNFEPPQDRSQIKIERSQLSHKEAIENPKDVSHAAPPTQRPAPSELEEPLVEESSNTLKPSTQSIHKYPPGEGPCRACGKEVDGKRIFSKRENELSGQWHRDCFRCLTCDVKFNKRTPCYILDDQPYCQQHYHENNGSICQVCKGFIEGECLENDRAERFHVHCLTCFLCKTRITSDYFIYNGELPLCSDHDIEVLLRDGLTGEPQSNENTVSKRRTRLITLGQA